MTLVESDRISFFPPVIEVIKGDQTTKATVRTPTIALVGKHRHGRVSSTGRAGLCRESHPLRESCARRCICSTRAWRRRNRSIGSAVGIGHKLGRIGPLELPRRRRLDVLHGGPPAISTRISATTPGFTATVTDKVKQVSTLEGRRACSSGTPRKFRPLARKRGRALMASRRG
jgi:hypothetical protein